MLSFLLCLAIAALATLSAAATIQRQQGIPSDSFIASASPKLILNTPSAVPLLGAGEIDPNFFAHFKDGKEDLSDKSVYLNTLTALSSLSEEPFDAPFDGGIWSMKDYPDVEIRVHNYPGLQINYAMWGLLLIMSQMHINQFTSCTAYLWYVFPNGVGPKQVGTIDITRGAAAALGSLGSNRSDIALTSSSYPLTYITSPGDFVLKNDSNDGSLGVRGWNINIKLEGPRLSKENIFTSIFASIVAAAGSNRGAIKYRSNVGFMNVDLTWEAYSLLAPDFEYGMLQWTLNKIAKYMYKKNKFQAGEWVFLVGDVQIGKGAIRRI